MSDDDTTVWQKVRRKRPHDDYAGPERRGPEPLTITDYMKFLPLAAAVIAGVTGYTKLESKVETLTRDMDRAIVANDKAHDELKASVKAQWVRLGDHLERHE